MAYEDKYPLALKAGTVLAGQFVIERVLGQGGFGITYAAADHKTGQRVAVKEFFPDSMATRMEKTTVVPFTGERGDSFSYGKDCFLKEAETLAQFIGNENIVRIHSYFEENGTAYFVMDYVEGNSFDVYIRKKGGKISFEDAKSILVPVMDALGAVHAKGIIHRDVTPDNIYITTKGTVKLLDFGAARYSLGDKSRSLDVVLKHGFAPKEQYTRRGKQGPYTDVYALGATFYYALTGRRPPDSVERMEVDDLVPPSNMGVKIPEAAEQAILQALNVAAQERFQSMAAFKQALISAEAADAQSAAQQPMQQAPVQQPMQQAPVQQPMQQAPMGNQPASDQTVKVLGTQGFDMLLGKPAAQPGQGGQPSGQNGNSFGNQPQTGMNNLYGQGTGQTNMPQRQTEMFRTGQAAMQQPQGAVQPGQGTVPYLPSGAIPQTYAQNGMPQTGSNMQQPVGGMQNVQPGMQQPGGAVPPAGQNITPPQASGNKKTGLIIGIAAAAVVLIALIIGGVFLFTKKEKPEDQIAANTPTPIPTSTPTPTHAPTKAPDPTTPPEPTELPTIAVQQAVLDKYPSVVNVNNVQCGSYLSWDTKTRKMYVSDYDSGVLYEIDIENDDAQLINEGENWSLSGVGDTLYFVSDGCAYTADEVNGTKTAIPELAAYDDISQLYVSDQAYFIYRYSDTGEKVSRVECIARDSGAPSGTVVLGYESGDPDPGTLQFTFCSGYFYYVLQSNNGRDYDSSAPIKVWRLPAGDLNDAPHAVLQDASEDKQKYRQLISDGSDLFLLLENPDGRCGIVMYDTLTDKITKNVNWSREEYYFNYMNVYKGKLYVYADVIKQGAKVILTMNKADDKFGTPEELCRLDLIYSLMSVQVLEMEGKVMLFYYGIEPDGAYRMIVVDTDDPANQEVLIGGEG
ncbi:MAG: protein kinase [Lachnospiraceae bacterium]|nr:protein kinase [Lachnospiraceae bacterium]